MKSREKKCDVSLDFKEFEIKYTVNNKKTKCKKLAKNGLT